MSSGFIRYGKIGTHAVYAYTTRGLSIDFPGTRYECMKYLEYKRKAGRPTHFYTIGRDTDRVAKRLARRA